VTESDDDATALAQQLMDLARQGAAELITYIDEGAPVNLTDSVGNTLVLLASYHGHAELTSALLARGADPNLANDKAQTPLSGAIFKGDPEIIRALVAGGADPSLGRPSAYETAQYFQREDLLALLR
jgi:ankyrin repeat protein